MASDTPRLSDETRARLRPQVGIELGVVALVWLFVLLRQAGIDAMGGWDAREPVGTLPYLIIAGAVTALFGVVIARKLRFTALLRARGVEVEARVLDARALPNLSRSMFARGRYLVRVSFPAAGGEQRAQVVCARKPEAETLPIVYDPRKPARVWSPKARADG